MVLHVGKVPAAERCPSFLDAYESQAALERSFSPASATDRQQNRGYKTVAKPRCFKSGDDITLFFERFKNFVKLSNVNGNLSLLLMNYVEDDSHVPYPP